MLSAGAKSATTKKVIKKTMILAINLFIMHFMVLAEFLNNNCDNNHITPSLKVCKCSQSLTFRFFFEPVLILAELFLTFLS